MTSQLQLRIALSQIKGLTAATARMLLAAVGSEENFFSASESSLRNLTGLDSELLSREYRDKLLENAAREVEFVDSAGIKLLYFADNYPERLAQCDDAPIAIYTLGDCNLDSAHIISIVGTRHATHYGVGFIDSLIEDLAKKLSDVVIVSGLAYGADIAAHRAAMRNNLPTVAVFATGLNSVYPAAHRNDAARIVHYGGMVMSEYTSSSNIHRANFLSRNRIVAGLADCTIVAESASKGGALVTARLAAAYGRDVFALPGRSTDIYSRGCNALIASNEAALIEDADDLIKAMNWKARPTEGSQPTLPIDLSDDEQRVIDLLREHERLRLNEISIKLNIPIGRLMSMMVNLEFKELVIPLPGSQFMLC